MTDAVTINLPELPVQLLPTVSQFTVLRALPSITLLTGDDYLVNGNDAVGDAGGGVFVWNAASTRDDNDRSIIKPDDLGPLQAGRWVLLADPSPQLAAAASALANATGSGLVGFSQSATYPTGSIGAHELNFICVTDAPFNAKGDGTTDDYPAILAAWLAADEGATIYYPPGTYRCSHYLAPSKRLDHRGGAGGATILFDNGTTLLDLGTFGKSAVYIADTTSTVASGNAVYSNFEGINFEYSGTAPSTLSGFVCNTVTFMNRVDITGFGKNGLAVLAGTDIALMGNANGCDFKNVRVLDSGGTGVYTKGNNANQCSFYRVRSFNSGDWGFDENGSLGSNYLLCEASTNVTGGFRGTDTDANTSSYVMCYAETDNPIGFQLGSRMTMISVSPIDWAAATAGAGFVGSPSNEMYFFRPSIFAATIQEANAASLANPQGAAGTGAFYRDGPAGWGYLPYTGAPFIKAQTLSSINYWDLSVGPEIAARLPLSDTISGNIRKRRFHLPNGLSLGATGDAAILGGVPAGGEVVAQGGMYLLTAPVSGGRQSKTCTTGGAFGSTAVFFDSGSIA